MAFLHNLHTFSETKLCGRRVRRRIPSRVRGVAFQVLEAATIRRLSSTLATRPTVNRMR